MFNLNIVITAYLASSFIYGFGHISRGVLKDSIAGFGILGIILVFVVSLFVLPIKQAFLLLVVWFLLLMPLSGFLMAWLESIIYKVPLKARRPVSSLNTARDTYLIGGIRKGLNEGKPYYGQGAKLLEETSEGWKIIVSPIQSEFLQEPKEVDEETFIKQMLSLGVPNIKIYEFLKYEIDWENF